MASLSTDHYRWLVVAYTLVIQGVSVGILVYCFALFSLPWLDEFATSSDGETSRRDVMVIISVLQIVMGALGPFVGRHLDHTSMRKIVLFGTALLAAGLYLLQFANAIWQIWVIYATIMPLASLMMGSLAAQTLVTKWFHSERGMALGISAMGTSLGGIVFPWLVAGWLTEHGWRDTLQLLAVLTCVVVIPLTLVVLRREPPARDDQTTQSSAAARMWTSREILSARRLFWLPFLALVPLTMGFTALQFNLGVFTRDLGLTDADAAPLIMVSSLCMVIGKFFTGGLGDRIDHRYLFWISAFLLVCACLFLLATNHYTGLLLGVICMGLSGGGILPMMGVIFGARFGAAAFGRVMGFVMVNVTLGAVTPIFAGWAYDVYGSYDLVLLCLIALALCAAVAMFWLPEPKIDYDLTSGDSESKSG